jgi:hypothetical protein
VKTDWMKPLLGRPGPFVTVYLDGSRGIEAGKRELDGVARTVRRELTEHGAPAALCDAVEERIVRPVRVPGPHGRVLIATEEHGVILERILSEPPTEPSVEYGPVPMLLDAARSADESVDYLLVVVDRLGGDLTWSWGGDPDRQPEPVSVEGGHDDITKTKTGSLSDKRIDNRAEDSWERNAEAVAREVDRQVVEHRPELVLLTGDVRAVGLVRDALAHRSAQLVVEVPGGSRAAGVHEVSFEGKVREAVAGFRDRRRGAVIDAYREGQGRDDGSVTELGDVVAVLQRGQVSELLLSALVGPGSELDERELWVGPEAVQLGLTREDVAELGASDGIHPLPAAVALVRAALGQDAGLTFVPDGAAELVDGVGAVLRWHDAGTPSESAPTMSADRGRLRDVV